MNTEAEFFHRLYGAKRQRITYQPKDALDYALMILATGAVLWFGFGAGNALTAIGLVLCAFMLVSFPIRHGVELRTPVILSRPQDVLYSLIYKIQNIKAPYLWALGLLLLENYVISVTPQWPHHVAWMRNAALYLFYGHVIVITLYRTAILVAHLYKKELVREILMQSIWKKSLERQPSIAWEIVHAYCTGLLTHIVLLVPWYLVIKYASFSLVLMPITVIAGAALQIRFAKVINDWFYRDHWVGHNSEFDFIYLHGTHHDAIPSGLIGVAGNGYLEGLLRGAVAMPTPFVNPLVAALYYTVEVKSDIDLHQYIPGVFPKLSREIFEVAQHSVHHFGRVEPYSFGVNVDQPHISDEVKKQFKVFPEALRQSIALDQRLTGYEWDNARYRWFMALVDRYHDAGDPPAKAGVTMKTATKTATKTDWVAEGFSAMRDCGEDISIVYGRVDRGAPRVEPEWAELPHDAFDGVGGLAHLLRARGCRVDELPVLQGDSLTLSRALRGLAAVFPTLKVRSQQWRNFDATRAVTFRPVGQRVAWKLLTELETKSIVAAAKVAGVTVNTLLLLHLDRAVAAQLVPESANRLWMIPVNLRGGLRQGHPETFLKMSFLPVDLSSAPSVGQLHEQIAGLKQRHCHWGSWAALHLGKLLGKAGMRKELRSRDQQNNGWTGIFSNLGVWNVPDAGHWIFGPAVSRVHPIGAGCLTINGCMALTVQLHEALGGGLEAAHDLMSAWIDPYAQAPAPMQRPTQQLFA